MQHHFFAYLSRMSLIKRWSLMRCFREENLAEHTLEVVQIAQALAIIGNTYFEQYNDVGLAVQLALMHDAPEVLTGDLPTPVKYFNPRIHSAYQEIEQVAEEKLLSYLPDELAEAYRPLLQPADSPELRLVKAADKISAHLKCLGESYAGNSDFRIAEQATLKAVEKYYDLPQVVWFMEHCLESYSRTLDELD
ncbi:MAG: 5'-deoxynucleotidase [Firmicutes bacterium]|nr:5'-deoxynucleotidase [Bacillota bacterium]